MALDLLNWCRLGPSNIRLPLSRHFYPKWLTVTRAYTFSSMGHPGIWTNCPGCCKHHALINWATVDHSTIFLVVVYLGCIQGQETLWLLHVEIEWIDLARFPILSERQSLLFYLIHFLSGCSVTLHGLNSSILCLGIHGNLLSFTFHSCCLAFIHVLLKNYKKHPEPIFSLWPAHSKGFLIVHPAPSVGWSVVKFWTQPQALHPNPT